MTWQTDYQRPGFTPPNPLAVGTFCECGTRLDAADRACPLCPTREEQQAEYFDACRKRGDA